MFQEFKIRGMDCAEEVEVLRREIAPLVGGERHLAFDILRGKMTVMDSSVPLTEIINAINKTGKQAEMWRDAPAIKPNLRASGFGRRRAVSLG
jgi:Cd2+/Zn2+-exporting ATPase